MSPLHYQWCLSNIFKLWQLYAVFLLYVAYYYFVYCILRYICVFQLHNGSLWHAVFIPWYTARSHYYACTPPRQKHYGLFTVALGNSVFHEHQHRQGYQKQSFHLCCTGQLLFCTHIPWSLCQSFLFPTTVLRTHHFFITIAGNSTYVYYDELPVQIPGWWSDQDQGLCQVCICGLLPLSFCVLLFFCCFFGFIYTFNQKSGT